jgi:CubicO group peptidase (beta-lactamase class C family)
VKFDTSTTVLTSALDAGVFSAVSAEVGSVRGPTWTYAAGQLSFEPDAAAVDAHTIFDLASLTKVLATATLGVKLVAAARLDLATPVSALIKKWSEPDRAAVTVRDLFEHCSGLPAHRRYFEQHAGRLDYEAAIAVEPLEYPPRQQSVYSDLGFILLGFILEDAGGAPLDQQFRAWRTAEEFPEPIDFRPPLDWRSRIASTGHDRWRGAIQPGEVHDENTAALGGVAGHAGLFGTAAAVASIARWWLGRLLSVSHTADAALARTFVSRSNVPGSSRALAWDTMLTTSSCGERWSARAIGHTGFTGTSLWIDPACNRYAVLLTNYVLQSRDREKIRQLRRAFHDAVVADSTS